MNLKKIRRIGVIAFTIYIISIFTNIVFADTTITDVPESEPGFTNDISIDNPESYLKNPKNQQLYNNLLPVIFHGYIGNGIVTASDKHKTIQLQCEPNTEYCISMFLSIGSRFAISCTEYEMVNGMSLESDIIISDETRYMSEYGVGKYKTLRTGKNSNYICIYYYNAYNDTAIDESEIRKYIKVEKGNMPTSGLDFCNPNDASVQLIDNLDVFLGDEMVTSNGYFDTGWYGNNKHGYTHIAGNTKELTFDIETEVNVIYLLEFDTSYTQGEFINVGIGDNYKNLVYNGSSHITMALLSDGGNLSFKPFSNFSGTISNISLKKIQSHGDKKTINIKSLLSENHKDNYGFWNTLLSHNSMENAVGSTRTVSIGYSALASLTGGHRNVGIGTFAMGQMIGGENNVSIGSDSMLEVTNADENVVIGFSAAQKGANLSKNVIIGSNAMKGLGKEADTSGTVAIGSGAGYASNGDKNVFIGIDASPLKNSADYSVAIGNYTLINGGSGITLIGSLSKTAKSIWNGTAIGYNTQVEKSNQVVIGNNNVIETLIKGNLVVRGADGIKRQIIFNNDGTISWEQVK